MPASDLVAGSLSGFVSCVLLQPLEVIKTRLQQQGQPLKPSKISSPLQTALKSSQTYLPSLKTSPTKSSSFREIMRPLISHPTTLWRGTVPTILRNVPGVSIYFYTLSFLRQSLLPKATRQSHSRRYVTLVNVSAGMLARAGAGFILMPISVIKVRFESNLYNYVSLAQAGRDILQTEGMRGFFSGFGATALRDAPYAGVHLAIYESTKALIGGTRLPFPLLCFLGAAREGC
jgi:solute carrier family 25 protein 38